MTSRVPRTTDKSAFPGFTQERSIGSPGQCHQAGTAQGRLQAVTGARAVQGGDEANPRQAESHHSLCRRQAQGGHGSLGEGLHGGPFPPSKATLGSLGRSSRNSSEGHSWATYPAHHGEQAATWRVTGSLPASGRRGLLRTADTARQSGSSCLLGSCHPPPRDSLGRPVLIASSERTRQNQELAGCSESRQGGKGSKGSKPGGSGRTGQLPPPGQNGVLGGAGYCVPSTRAHIAHLTQRQSGPEAVKQLTCGPGWQATLATTRHLGLHRAPRHPCSQCTLLSGPGGPQSRWPGALGLQSPAQPPAPPYPAWGPTLYMHLWKSLRTPLSSSSSRATSFS